MVADEFEEFERDEMDRRLPVAKHELGHFTVARVLGFEAGDVVLAPSAIIGGAAGTASIKLLRPLKSSCDILMYCEGRIMVLFGGAIAEALEGGKVDNDAACSFSESTAQNDHAKARELLNIVRGIMHPETTDESFANAELKEISDRLWSRTVEIVERNEKFIDSMAWEIVKREVRSTQAVIFTQWEISNHVLFHDLFLN